MKGRRSPRGPRRPRRLSTRLLPRVELEVIKYLKTKPEGGFSHEGELAFLSMATRDPINWNVSGAAVELLGTVWKVAWRNVTKTTAEAAERARKRQEMIDKLAEFVAREFEHDPHRRRAEELLARARDAAPDQRAWDQRRGPDQAALSALCRQAKVIEVERQPSFAFVFDGGRREFGPVFAFPDANVPGGQRQVLVEAGATIGQYELHCQMSRDHVIRADKKTGEKEDNLEWLLDRSGGDRRAPIINFRDRPTPPPPPSPEHRPAA
jgi:hypothetical protein